MNKFSIDFKTVTPLFCRGKDSKTAEIRAPSIKGQLRWWYRAWNPKALAQNDDSKWSEGTVMGGAGEKIPSSPFILRVKQITPLTGSICDWQEIKDNTVRGNQRQVGGVQYLGFSFGFNRSDAKENCCLRADTEFKADNIFPYPEKCTEEVAKSVIASWWLLGHLGGLGARSRRCFGSLAIQKWTWPEMQHLLDEMPLPYHASNATQWKANMTTGLNVLQDWLPLDAKWPSKWHHPHLGPKTNIILDTIENWNSAKDAMEYAGRTLANMRKSKKGDSRDIDGRVTVGLPLVTGKSVKKEWQPDSYETVPVKTDRSGSALHMHLAQWKDGYGVCWTRTDGPIPGLDMFRVNVKKGRSHHRDEVRKHAQDTLSAIMDSLPGTQWTPGETHES